MDEDMQGGWNRPDDRPPALLRREVGGDDKGSARLLRYGAQRILPAPHEMDVEAALRERHGNGTADAAAGARDQGCLTLKRIA